MLIFYKILLEMKSWERWRTAERQKKWRIVFLFFPLLVTPREFKTNTVLAASTRI